MGVEGQGFFRSDAVPAETAECSGVGGVIEVQPVDGIVGESADDEVVDGFIEVHAAELLDPFWRAEQFETGIGLREYRRIERATAKVVHRDHFSYRDSFGGGIGDGRGLGLGHRDDLEVAHSRRLAQ